MARRSRGAGNRGANQEVAAGEAMPAAEIAPDGFVHLHLHTEYSLLDGGNRIGRLVARVKELGMTAVAMTDHGNLYGAVGVLLKAKEAGIKPILGIEAYVAPDRDGKPGDRRDRTHTGVADGGFHLVLLAENAAGWSNLLKLSSDAYLNGFYYKPRMDKSTLAEWGEGLIAINGHLGSSIAHHLTRFADRATRALAGGGRGGPLARGELRPRRAGRAALLHRAAAARARAGADQSAASQACAELSLPLVVRQRRALPPARGPRRPRHALLHLARQDQGRRGSAAIPGRAASQERRRDGRALPGGSRAHAEHRPHRRPLQPRARLLREPRPDGPGAAAWADAEVRSGRRRGLVLEGVPPPSRCSPSRRTRPGMRRRRRRSSTRSAPRCDGRCATCARRGCSGGTARGAAARRSGRGSNASWESFRRS